MLTVVGICGHSRAGKDTVAGVLTAVGGFTRVGLADGVREALSALNGPTWELLKDVDYTAGGTRQMMKVAGTECREDILSHHHWINHALVKIRFASHYHTQAPRLRFVVPDIRFPHEPQRLREVVQSWGGRYLTVKVERPGCGGGGHASETAVDSIPYDHIILNNSSRDCLVGWAMALCDLFAEAPVA